MVLKEATCNEHAHGSQSRHLEVGLIWHLQRGDLGHPHVAPLGANRVRVAAVACREVDLIRVVGDSIGLDEGVVSVAGVEVVDAGQAGAAGAVAIGE